MFHDDTDDPDYISRGLSRLIPDAWSLSKATKGVQKRLGFFADKYTVSEKSELFDFEGKVDSVVKRFAACGLKRSEYIIAAIKEPRLFIQNPDTIIESVEKLEQYCSESGITRGAYLRAILAKQPGLACKNPATMISHVEGVLNRFNEDGLTRQEYVTAAVKQPALFALKPETIVNNVEGVLRHFSPDGLARPVYLHAAAKHPSLFTLNPAKIIGNVENVVREFASEGLSCKDYLHAVIRQPSLLGLKPSTIIAHIRLISEMYKNNNISNSKSGHVGERDAIVAALQIALKNPIILGLSDENLMLRMIYQSTFAKKTVAEIFSKTRNDVERELTQALDLPSVIPPISNAGSKDEVGDHARRLLLRALIHEGFVKGRAK